MLRSRLASVVHLGRRYKTLNLVELSRTAMLSNVRLVQKQHPAFGIIPVLKSNAYGHGLNEVAVILNGADVPFLAVDGYFEAARIRRVSRQHLLVLGYIAPENASLLDTHRCSFVVQDTAMLAALGRLHRRVRVHVELNTGMNRLGLNTEELPGYLAVLKKYKHLELEGVMSHLADADNPDDDTLTRQQVAVFDRAVEQIAAQGFRPRYIHIAQTAGSTKVQSKYTNALRLGIGLYGINPLARADPQSMQLAGLKPVLSLKSTIVKVINLKPGDVVGYNATFRTDKPMRIGVLPVGYYEGVPRELSNVGRFTAGRHTLPIVGRVSMNHTMVDLGASGAGVGDEVTVFSGDHTQPNAIAHIAADHGLFAYTLLTGIASSIRRKIV